MMKYISFYNEIKGKNVYVEVPKRTRNQKFRDFAEKITKQIAKDGLFKAGGKKQASKKAAVITGVKPETAKRYLGYLEENGYIGFNTAGVIEIVGQKVELEDMEIQPQLMDEPTMRKGIWRKFFPRLESGKALVRLRTGRVFPRFAAFLDRFDKDNP